MPARQYRVLAVDDNEIHCYSLRKLLAAAGFEVTHAHSGNEALSVFRQNHPDAVLLDVGLGDMNGFEVCGAIRSDPVNNNVAVIFHSASGHASASPVSTDNGADAFLTYPVDSEHLISVIRGCIQRRLDNHGKTGEATGQAVKGKQE
jgi:DNA-binding response OmpR family regulator